MKVNTVTLKNMIAEGRVPPVMAAFRSQYRSLAATENLLRERADHLAKIRNAFAELQDERDRLARACDYMHRWFRTHGMSDTWRDVEKKFRLERIR